MHLFSSVPPRTGLSICQSFFSKMFYILSPLPPPISSLYLHQNLVYFISYTVHGLILRPPPLASLSMKSRSPLKLMYLTIKWRWLPILQISKTHWDSPTVLARSPFSECSSLLFTFLAGAAFHLPTHQAQAQLLGCVKWRYHWMAHWCIPPAETLSAPCQGN